MKKELKVVLASIASICLVLATAGCTGDDDIVPADTSGSWEYTFLNVTSLESDGWELMGATYRTTMQGMIRVNADAAGSLSIEDKIATDRSDISISFQHDPCILKQYSYCGVVVEYGDGDEIHTASAVVDFTNWTNDYFTVIYNYGEDSLERTTNWTYHTELVGKEPVVITIDMDMHSDMATYTIEPVMGGEPVTSEHPMPTVDSTASDNSVSIIIQKAEVQPEEISAEWV